MKYKCPRCGKIIELSDDELASQGNVMVCPCCLMEFQGNLHEYAVPAEADSIQRQYYYGLASDNPSPAVTYCRYCGAKISDNCNFCPVCGSKLTQEAVPQPQGAPRKTPNGNAPRVAPKTKKQPVQMPYMPSYRYNMGQYVPHKKAKAAKWMYAVMVALGILLIYLVSC